MISLNPALLTQDWFIAKIFMLILLVAYSLSLEYFRKALYEDRCNKSGKFLECTMKCPQC